MKKLLTIALFSLATLSLYALPQGLQQYTLSNGLTVYLWEDANQPDVSGWVITRAGSYDEPADYTGLAHYLEHMLFKGTQEIGALDWEKEKPLYEQIIKLYDDYSATTDKEVRLQLIKEINKVSREAAQYTATDDFSNLVESMGGEGLNANTSTDRTVYFNNFPANQMEKWLKIYSDRLINPVFRSFQAELENVFEEFNMYQDMMQSHTSNFLFEKLYGTEHPYGRDIIGTADHLKNPRLSKLIDFYNTWYVPNNMALILVGNFDAEATKPLIEQYFSRLEEKPLPAPVSYNEPSFAGNPKHTLKAGYYPQIVWGYKGVKANDTDALLLQVCVSLLSNGMSTGLLDKLTLDGTVNYAGADCDFRREGGRIIVLAIPYFDVNQQMYESNRATENIIFKEIEKLKTGQIEDWLINTVKEEYAQGLDMAFESSDSKIGFIVNSFVNQEPLEQVLNMKERIMAFTKEDFQRIAKQYFDTDHITLQFDEGTPKKNKLAKPEIEPLDPPKGETAYSKNFKAMEVKPMEATFNNFADVTKVKIDDHITLHYTHNNQNDIFSLTLIYGIGTEKMPKLEYAVDLMNKAGIMPATDAQQFRRQLAELGGYCGYVVNDSYFAAYIQGNEHNLADICQLVQRQILMPKLEQQQLDNIKGSEFSNRLTMSKVDNYQANALLLYALYGKKSAYLDMMPFMDVYYLTIPQLHGEFQEATSYDLDIHYVGAKPIEEVKTTLIGNLPLKEGMRASTSPEIKERQTYDKNTIFFLPNSNVQQAKVYFYINGLPYTIGEEAAYQAFDQYFSGGFSGLVMNEIREKRSMAYTAYGYNARPQLPNKESYFLGYVGTQSDKVADAIDVYMDLLTNMPQYPDRIDNIKTYLRQSNLTNKPSMRSKSQVYASWEEMGYTDDPAKSVLPALENMTYEQIQEFYTKHIQGKPITIVIMGDAKQIDLKRISAKYGKVTKLSKGRLFAPVELDF